MANPMELIMQCRIQVESTPLGVVGKLPQCSWEFRSTVGAG